jgi:hypothetical protein
MADRDAFNWVIGPVGRAIAYVAEETNVASTLHRSLMVLEANESFLRLSRETLKAKGADAAVRGIDELLAEAPSLSKTSAELKADDFAVVNSHSFIAMWGALEMAIEDTISLVLEKDQKALELVAKSGTNTGPFEPGPLSEDDARSLYRRIETRLRRDLTAGEFYLRILEILGIDVTCSRHVLSKLQEANSVRNCLLHRGGIIDERAAQSSGALRSLKGKRIHITRSRYLEYYDAVVAFLQEMLKAVIASPYNRVANGKEETT